MEASGEITGKEGEKYTPKGGGKWGCYALKGKIGETQTELGPAGSAIAGADGTLELGIPRASKVFDAGYFSGSYEVYVFVKP